jgi:hypothetical protein
MIPTATRFEFMDAQGATIPFLPPGLVRIQGLWARQDGSEITLVLCLANDEPLGATVIETRS